VQSVLNCLRILDEVAVRQPVGVGELSRVLGRPKTSVQRALKTLQEAGWIRPAGDGLTGWCISTKVLQVSAHTCDICGHWPQRQGIRS
jgi:IclR family acetate operon transcriptional repressor